MNKKTSDKMVVLGVKQEDLEDSIRGLSGLKSVLQRQVLIANSDKRQGKIDSAELGKHFDTAIEAMTILLSGFDDYKN